MPPVPKVIPLPPTFAKQLEADVETKLRKRLGIKPTDATPPELKQLITQEVAKAGAPIVQNKIATEVRSTMASLAQARTVDRFKENLAVAKNGIATIAAANDVNAILKDRADLLFKKKTALETAGFTPAEAMQIVLADIESKAH